MSKYTTLDSLLAETITDDNGCAIWQKSKSKGYGRIRLGSGKSIGVHRLALMLATNQNGYGLYAIHSCDNPACINADHLRWGTQAENMADTVARNRRASKAGESNGRAKLSAKQVEEIKNIQGFTLQQIADQYGVSNQLVSRIRNNKAWVSA